jgi:DNA-binding NarL/FixJ family response regulator
MAANTPQFDPNDGTRPPLFTAEEWRRIVTALRLSRRPAQVLGLAVQGLYHHEICRQLDMKPGTLRVHLARCCKALDTRRKLKLAYETFALFRRLPENS